MTPVEALQYLSQIANDYVRQLPPSAAMPTTQCANEALSTLAPLVQTVEPPPEVVTPERTPLRAVSPDAE